MQKNKSLNAIFFMYCALIAIDGFPLGAQLLREFGARPSNFILITIIPFLINERLLNATINKYDALLALLTITAIASCVNLIWADYNLILGKKPVTQFINQLLMLIWMTISIFGVMKILSEYDNNNLTDSKEKIFCATAYINILAFFIHYAIVIEILPPTFIEIFSAIKSNLDLFRASGLSTEPSLYGAWIVWIWPLIFFQNFSKFNIATTSILILTGILSGSRTFLVIILIQGIFILYIKLKEINYRLIITLIFLFSIAIPLLGPRLVSTFDIYDNLSSIARIASTIASVNTYLDNYVFGVGLGQFSAYYPNYVPEFGFASEEVIEWIGGDINNRVSTFNLFTRIAAETGTIGLMIVITLLTLLVAESTKITKKSQSKTFISYMTSAIGGISFWLSQDQFGYQPGIFGIAALYHIINQSKKNEQ